MAASSKLSHIFKKGQQRQHHMTLNYISGDFHFSVHLPFKGGTFGVQNVYSYTLKGSISQILTALLGPNTNSWPNSFLYFSSPVRVAGLGSLLCTNNNYNKKKLLESFDVTPTLT